MPKFPELTEAQREPLFALVRFQRNVRKSLGTSDDVPFFRHLRDPWDIAKAGSSGPVVTQARPVLVELWDSLGYVQTGTNDTDLLLRQLAQDYADYWAMRWFHRWAVDTWHDSRTELKAAILAFAVSVGVNLLGKVIGW